MTSARRCHPVLGELQIQIVMRFTERPPSSSVRSCMRLNLPTSARSNHASKERQPRHERNNISLFPCLQSSSDWTPRHARPCGAADSLVVCARAAGGSVLRRPRERGHRPARRITAHQRPDPGLRDRHRRGWQSCGWAHGGQLHAHAGRQSAHDPAVRLFAAAVRESGHECFDRVRHGLQPEHRRATRVPPWKARSSTSSTP